MEGEGISAIYVSSILYSLLHPQTALYMYFLVAVIIISTFQVRKLSFKEVI